MIGAKFLSVKGEAEAQPGAIAELDALSNGWPVFEPTASAGMRVPPAHYPGLTGEGWLGFEDK